jgi:hypothetical protein
VDALALGDRTPRELGELIGVPTNLLAHHLGVLDGAGLIERRASSGDGRRRYVVLRPDPFATLVPPQVMRATKLRNPSAPASAPPSYAGESPVGDAPVSIVLMVADTSSMCPNSSAAMFAIRS